MNREEIIEKVQAYTGMEITELTTLCHNHIDEVQDLITSGVYYDVNGTEKQHDFSFLIDFAEINTTESYADGTITVTQDSTTVTGSGTAFTDSMVGRYVKVSGSDDYYEIESITGDSELELKDAYNGETQSGASYVIYRIFYPLASDFKKMKYVKQVVTPARVVPLQNLETARYVPDEFDESGEIYGYIVSGLGADGYLQIRFLPFQTARKRVYYCYERDLPTINDTGAESVIPDKWHSLFVYGLSEIVFQRTDLDLKAQGAKSKFNEMLRRMVKEDRTISKDNLRVMADENPISSKGYVRLPGDYPQISR